MTTSVLSNYIETITETYYKYDSANLISQNNTNTFLKFGFNTNFSINFGFNLDLKIDLNRIELQPGVLTNNSVFQVYPNLSIESRITCQNNIVMPVLPQSGFSTVTIVSKKMPFVIELRQGIGTVIGIASSLLNCALYDQNVDNDQMLYRFFESNYSADNSNLSGFCIVDFEQTTVEGISTNWTIKSGSIYKVKTIQYNSNNGYGGFETYEFSKGFQERIFYEDPNQNFYFQVAYQNVFYYINNLNWEGGFSTWWSINSNLLGAFTQRFIREYFNI